MKTRIAKRAAYPNKHAIGRTVHARQPSHMTADDPAVIAGSRFAAFQRRGERAAEVVPGSRFAAYLARGAKS